MAGSIRFSKAGDRFNSTLLLKVPEGNTSRCRAFYYSRNPASRHRFARKELRLRTQKPIPGGALQALYISLMERFQQGTDAGVDETLEADDPD